jgi:hypothetical protein
LKYTTDPLVNPAPVTVSVKFPVLIGDGLTDEMFGIARTVTAEAPEAPGDAVLVARTVTVAGLGTAGGAEYWPLELMTPTTPSPPGIPFTLHVTVFAAPVTVAVKVWVRPVRTVADAGVTVTETPFCIAAPELGSILSTVASTASKFEPRS